MITTSQWESSQSSSNCTKLWSTSCTPSKVFLHKVLLNENFGTVNVMWNIQILNCPQFEYSVSVCVCVYIYNHRIFYMATWCYFVFFLFSIDICNQACCYCSVTRLCPTLCNPMDCNLSSSSVHGISQARILEWVAISFSKGSSWPRGRTCISCICRWILYYWTTWETQSDMNSVLFSKNCVPNFTLPDCSRHTDMASSLCSRFLTELCFCLGNPPSYTWPYVSVSQFQ